MSYEFKKQHPLRYDFLKASTLYSRMFADLLTSSACASLFDAKIDLFRFESARVDDHNSSVNALNAPTGMLDRLAGLKKLLLRSENGSFALHNNDGPYRLFSFGNTMIQPALWRQPKYLLNHNRLQELTLHTNFNEALPLFLEDAEAPATQARVSPGVVDVRKLTLDATIVYEMSSEKGTSIYRNPNDSQWAVHTPSEKALISRNLFLGLKELKEIHIEGGKHRSRQTNAAGEDQGIYFDNNHHQLTRTEVVNLIALAPKLQEVTFPDAMRNVLPIEADLQSLMPAAFSEAVAKRTAADFSSHSTLKLFKMGDFHFERVSPNDEFERVPHLG
jgi:hypothetical protein